MSDWNVPKLLEMGLIIFVRVMKFLLTVVKSVGEVRLVIHSTDLFLILFNILSRKFYRS